MSEFETQYESLRSMIERRLDEYFVSDEAQSLCEAIRYSTLAGGKRVRPVITLAFCIACGGDEQAALDAACAVELLHTYSLVHDDLPAMDDDDLRRGKPSNHKAFGEWLAILTGDALQAAAFEKIAGCPLPADRIVKMVTELARAAGERGMCAGQALDMAAERQGDALGIEEIEKIHSLKTAALIEAAARIGVYAAGGTAEQCSAASEYARGIGLAFQIRDDILDAESTEETLGKPVGSDKQSGKATFYSHLGRDKCEEIIESETKRAVAAVQNAFAQPEFLCGIAKMLAERES